MRLCQRLNEGIGKSVLFLIDKATSSLGAPDYVSHVTKGEDNMLWIDDSTGRVIYENGSGMAVLDKMLDEGVELDEYTVAMAILDMGYSSGFNIFLAFGLISIYFCIVCVVDVGTTLYQEWKCGRMSKREDCV